LKRKSLNHHNQFFTLRIFKFFYHNQFLPLRPPRSLREVLFIFPLLPLRTLLDVFILFSSVLSVANYHSFFILQPFPLRSQRSLRETLLLFLCILRVLKGPAFRRCYLFFIFADLQNFRFPGQRKRPRISPRSFIY